jgi:hypothetical protein
MTYIRPGLRARTPPEPLAFTPARPRSPLDLDPEQLRAAILAKRSQIATLENAWVAASEHAAGGRDHLGDRATWDRTTWARYLDAAAASQDDYMPRLRRLYTEIARLEQLQMSLPAVTGRAA